MTQKRKTQIEITISKYKRYFYQFTNRKQLYFHLESTTINIKLKPDIFKCYEQRES